MNSKSILAFGLEGIATMGASILRNQYTVYGPENSRPGRHSDGSKTLCCYTNKTGCCGLISQKQKDGYDKLPGYYKVFNGQDIIRGFITEIGDPGRPLQLIADNSELISEFIVQSTNFIIKKRNLAKEKEKRDREKYINTINTILDLTQKSVSGQGEEKTFVKSTQVNDVDMDNCLTRVA